MNNHLDSLKNKKNASRYIQDSPLKQEQAIFWIYAAFEQGYNLSKDSMVLYKKGRIGSSLNLLLLALEELSKPKIILEYMSKGIRSQQEWDKAKKKLLNHESKLENVFIFAYEFIGKSEKHDIDQVFRKITDLEFNPLQALKQLREISTYTSAYEEGVLTPERIAKSSKELIPLLIGLIKDIYKDTLKIWTLNAPKLVSDMKYLFYATSDEQYYLKEKDFEKEVGKYIYFLLFLKRYFQDPSKAFHTIMIKKSLFKLVRRISDKKCRRRYRVTFELLVKSQQYDDEMLLKFLFSQKLPKLSQKLFSHAQKKDLLLRP